MIKYSLSLSLLLFYSAVSVAADISIYSVTINNCPTTLKISMPAEFRTATTPNEVNLRSQILSVLNRPYDEQPYSKAKAQYSEIYRIQWDSKWPPFPRIQISSLGSVQKAQGNISNSTWREIKNATINANKSERNRRYQKIKQYFKRHGAEVSVKWLEPYELDENTVVLNAIGETSVPDRDNTLKYIAGSKLIYVHDCVASVSVYVDLETPNAFTTLDNYLANIDIR